MLKYIAENDIHFTINIDYLKLEITYIIASA